MRLATSLAIVVLAAALLAGCGSSSSSSGGSTQTGSTAPSKAGTSGGPIGASARSCDTHAGDAEGLRAVGVSCGEARRVLYGWQRTGACSSPSGASRSSCSTGSYRCLGAKTDRGVAVSCSRPGRSVAFIAKRG